MRKETRKLLKKLEQQGARLTKTRDGWLAWPPDKSKPAVSIHETESDHRAWANTIARLKRSGFDL